MYLGNTPATSFETVRKQVSTSNSGTTITLDFPVTNVQDILVTVDAVIQSYDNYSVSGNTLTLGGTLNNNRVEILYVGRTFQSVAPSDGSVTRDKLHLVSDGSNPSLIAKGTSGVSEGYIQLNCAENSHGVKIKSPPHSAGQSYTLTLPQSVTNNGFLKTDGSGNLSFASTNYPAFEAYLSAHQEFTNSTSVKVNFNTEDFDTDNCYDNSTNYRFTPNVAGKYFVYSVMRFDGRSNANLNLVSINIYKNGSQYKENQSYFITNYIRQTSMATNAIIDMNGSSDYLEIYAYMAMVSGSQDARVTGGSTRPASFGAYRIGA